MDIRSENRGDVTVFYLNGELDFYNSPFIREELNKVIDGMEFQKEIPTTENHIKVIAERFSCRNRKKILISFKDVIYIDSSGLATLIELYQKVKKWQGDIILVDMEKVIRGVFELSRLDKIFTILPAIQDGVDAFSKK